MKDFEHDNYIQNLSAPVLVFRGPGQLYTFNKSAFSAFNLGPGLILNDFFDNVTVSRFKNIFIAGGHFRLAENVLVQLKTNCLKPDLKDSYLWEAIVTKLGDDGEFYAIQLMNLNNVSKELKESIGALRNQVDGLEKENLSQGERLNSITRTVSVLSQNTYQIDRFGKYEVLKDSDDLILAQKNRTGIFWDDLKEELVKELWQMLRHSMVEGKVLEKDFLLKNDNDKPLWINIRCSASSQFSFINYSDITERKESLEKLIRDERLSTIGVLAGGLAHQYNNLHHAVIALLYEAKSTSGEEQAKILTNASSLLSSGAELSRNLLSHVRSPTSVSDDVNLNQLFSRVSLLVKDELLKFKCTLDIAKSDFIVTANSTSLDQVLVNLILNGAHATADTGRAGKIIVKVDMDENNDLVEIEVIDNGCGIEKENISRLFTPLFSTKGVYAGSKSKLSKIQGTGLGLSLARQLVEEQGGQLILKKTDNNGTCFSIFIPLAKKQTVSASATLENEQAQLLTESDDPKLKIYVADDSKENRRILKIYLDEHLQGFVEKENGLVDHHELHDFNPDIIFLDWMMPDYNGQDFLDELSKSENSKAFLSRTIILSGLDSSSEIESWRGKVKGIMHKPIDQKNLVAAIRELNA